MNDPRNAKLAKNLVDYSCRVKKGDMVFISVKGDSARDLGKALIQTVLKAGGSPFWYFSDEIYSRDLILNSNESQLKQYSAFYMNMLKKCDCYIGISGSRNVYELSEVPSAKMKVFRKLFQEPLIKEIIGKKKRWVSLRYPDYSMAQLAKMPRKKFADFYYDVCCLNYAKMSKAMDPLVKLMQKTNKVHLKSKGTDLEFSIKGIPVIKCDGDNNIPDGEVFTAPVKNTVNGVISFNTPTLYDGTLFENIRLDFDKGKTIKATCSGGLTNKLNKILDTDPGARYVGEFAIGVNPLIKEPMNDILFDEKIDGSIHFTPGRCYDDASNGNKSAIHWDMVLIQRPDYGGGEIWFDDKLIRKNGKFIVPQLKNKFTKNALR